MRRAGFGLLLTLLVPARAAALCCLGGIEMAAPAAEAHAAHHAPAPAAAVHHAPASSAPAIADADTVACEAPETAAPALRERGPAEDARNLAAPAPGPPPSPTSDPAVRGRSLRAGNTALPARHQPPFPLRL